MARTIRNNPDARKAAAKRNKQAQVRRSTRRETPTYTLPEVAGGSEYDEWAP